MKSNKNKEEKAQDSKPTSITLKQHQDEPPIRRWLQGYSKHLSPEHGEDKLFQLGVAQSVIEAFVYSPRFAQKYLAKAIKANNPNPYDL
jgi:hypothetical protein